VHGGNEIAPPALGVSWDGTGYGLDGTVWGGEFFLVTDESVERIAHLRPFRLPGGDKAVKEPRAAAGTVHELSSVQSDLSMQVHQKVACAFSPRELATLETMLAKKLNSPVTTSMGRLFDAVASLVNLRQQIRFEGQAAMELEFALDGVETDEPTRCGLRNADCGIKRRTKARPTPNSELQTPNWLWTGPPWLKRFWRM